MKKLIWLSLFFSCSALAGSSWIDLPISGVTANACSAGQFADAIAADGTLTCATPSGGSITIGTFGSTPTANAASASGTTITMQPADGTHPGSITSGTQTIGGAKTFSGGVTATVTGHSTLDLAAASNLSDVASKAASSQNIQTGAQSLSGTSIDWATVSNGGIFYKTISTNPTFTFANLVDGMTIQVVIITTGSFIPTWPTTTWQTPDGSQPVQRSSGATVWTFIRVNGITYGIAA